MSNFENPFYILEKAKKVKPEHKISKDFQNVSIRKNLIFLKRFRDIIIISFKDMEDIIKVVKVAKILECKLCNYKCSKKSNIEKHFNTTKHYNNKNNTIDIVKVAKVEFICSCEKSFRYNSGLWRHKKTCKLEKIENNEENSGSLMFEILKQNNDFKTLMLEQSKYILEQKNTPTANNDLIVAELLKQNNEFKELMLEQSKYMLEQNKAMMELASKAGNNNNNTNNSFNLTFYLNETCKDAVNIDDFIQSVALQLSDLDYTRKYGYVAGITNILLRGLKAIDVNKRPFHCCDIKREIIYIKHDGVWEKDDNNKSKMIKAIKQISHRNFLQIEEWRNKNPSSRDVESKKNTEYLYIMREVLGGPTTNNDANSYNKIIRNIMKEILIDKGK